MTFEERWWDWHHRTALKNGMLERQARELADLAVKSIRKRPTP